jgi:hypothetical protein
MPGAGRRVIVVAGVRGEVAPVRFPKLQSREWLHAAYVERGLTTTQIGEALGCTSAAVSAALKRHGIPARPRNAPLGPGYRRKMRVKRAVRTQKARDRQLELRHAVALGPRARAVAEAHRKGDAAALRRALIELAACAEGWASLIPVGREVAPEERANGARQNPPPQPVPPTALEAALTREEPGTSPADVRAA